jgi:transcriptional regulator with XRE-family HTH domain
MDFTKIKNLAKKRDLNIKELSEKIEMSEANFYKCINRGSIETKHLEKIAKVLNVPVSYFFDEPEQNGLVINNGNFNGNNVSEGSRVLIKVNEQQHEIDRLKEKLHDKEELIEELRQRLIDKDELIDEIRKGQ